MVGLVTVVALVVGAFAAYRAQDLPLIGVGTKEYTAQFAESAGLSPSDEVRVSGIRVGRVTDVGLSRGMVLVRFQVSRARLGDQSRVSIEIKTLLGEKYLAVHPAGAGEQDPDVPIPVSRTTTPFEIPDAFNHLTRTVNEIDTSQLAQSFRVLSQTFANTPESFRGTLDGLSRLSQTIASRDQALSSLLADTSKVSGVVAQRNQQVATLLSDGSTLLAELQRRKEAFSRLLDGTQRLADQLRGLVSDNRAQLRPALDELDQLTKLLARDQDTLAHGIRSLAPYMRAYNNMIGNGRWYDGYFCGLLSPTVKVPGFEVNPRTCGPVKTANVPMTSGSGR